MTVTSIPLCMPYVTMCFWVDHNNTVLLVYLLEKKLVLKLVGTLSSPQGELVSNWLEDMA